MDGQDGVNIHKYPQYPKDDNVIGLNLYVTRRVTLGPNAQMTSLSKMTSKKLHQIIMMLKRIFTGPQKL